MILAASYFHIKENELTIIFYSECFIDMVEHKFKYTLRNLLKMLKDDQILVCFSGGASSLAMLKLVSETLFNPKAKKMFFKAKVLYIDESAIYGTDGEEEIKKISDFCKNLKYSPNLMKLIFLD